MMSLGGDESLSDLHDCESEQHIIRKDKNEQPKHKMAGANGLHRPNTGPLCPMAPSQYLPSLRAKKGPGSPNTKTWGSLT